jgi:hypothetical protein
MTDVDINERLNGLVTLLHAVGIDGVDPESLLSEQHKLSKGGSNSTPSTQSSDSQIVELIKKLQLAQADSPEILAALRSPELRALATIAAHAQAPKKAPTPAPSLDDVMDDDDNYPKIGPGYSDDISVMSDLTTPTVMTKQNVMEEEFYKDVNGGPGALPPMHIGLGANQPSRPQGAAVGHNGGHGPKQKNLVSSVMPIAASRRAIAKTGGAAAQRRLNYQQAMAKLQSSEYGSSNPTQDQNYMEHFSPKHPKPAIFKAASPTPSKTPSELPSLVDEGKAKSIQQTRTKAAVKEKKGKKLALSAQEEDDFELDYDPMAPKYDQIPSSEASHSSAGRKKKEKSSPSNDIEWSGAGTSGWPAFERTDNDDTLFVDNDGFFPSSEVFQSQSPTQSRTTSKVRRDGEPKSRKPRKEGEKKPSTRKSTSKSKRASLAM